MILADLLQARLNGKVSSAEDERRLVLRKYSTPSPSPQPPVPGV